MSLHHPPKPRLTESEVSLHEAHAGRRAREVAAALGGDPDQISSLMRNAGAPGSEGYRKTIAGIGLHGACLAVALASGAIAAHPQIKGAPTDATLQVARMAALLHDPVETYMLLSTGDEDDLREFDRLALGLTALWTPEDIAAFAAYYRSAAPKPPADDEGEASQPLGKRERRLNRRPTR